MVYLKYAWLGVFTLLYIGLDTSNNIVLDNIVKMQILTPIEPPCIVTIYPGNRGWSTDQVVILYQSWSESSIYEFINHRINLKLNMCERF